jgi:hypothetical protein
MPIMMKEADPNGLRPSDAGAKLDSGKIEADQLLGMFSRALTAVAGVGSFGARKYSMGGWQSVENGQERYADALMRHWLKMKGGEEVDPDSGLLHHAHLAWNALATLELKLRNM